MRGAAQHSRGPPLSRELARETFHRCVVFAGSSFIADSLADFQQRRFWTVAENPSISIQKKPLLTPVNAIPDRSGRSARQSPRPHSATILQA